MLEHVNLLLSVNRVVFVLVLYCLFNVFKEVIIKLVVLTISNFGVVPRVFYHLQLMEFIVSGTKSMVPGVVWNYSFTLMS